MPTQEQKMILLDFMRKHQVGVLSTVTPDGKSESATVALTETENLELIFETFTYRRKYTNLVNNPHVSVVIGVDPSENITIQYEGVAHEVSSEEQKKLQEMHVAKSPGSKPCETEENRTFLITPTWVRYYDVDKEESFEILLPI